MTSRVAVIINPISGASRPLEAARSRVELALGRLASLGVEAEALVSEHPGHPYDLALAAVGRGATLVFAWGGDGTINQVGRAVSERDASLAIIPGGSGNGLARELGVPARPDRAIEAALAGTDRLIDAGDLEGRRFFNVAGLGFDARVAARFNARQGRRRGPVPYVTSILTELLAGTSEHLEIAGAGLTFAGPTLFVALANSRQYGIGARIAPEARLDDGLLDLVVVEARPAWRALLQAPRLFTGGVERVQGVRAARFSELTIRSDGPIPIHVDGEPALAGRIVTARVVPGALKIRVPKRDSS